MISNRGGDPTFLLMSLHLHVPSVRYQNIHTKTWRRQTGDFLKRTHLWSMIGSTGFFLFLSFQMFNE